ncbi:AAA family ATPase [Phenylobacterium kunshanense]|uniref:ATPase n=1 Tax=Phenylobacterium kunshanense TaxID=1445034 RepID=A0A328BBF7_9CAUL|nr:AAA family ATPase [Phenylobacterium kunshanense]RAK63084.1 ATPase [Phenylobacterium kunshanense]
MHKPNFFVLTGGPGVGKTTVLRRLASLGEQVVEETARAVVREAMASGGQETPWLDNPAFVAACARRDIAIFDRMAGETRRVLFDRGIIDSHGANGVPPWPELDEAVRTRRYNPKVFLFPPWREIYETDAERRQDWPEAERTFELIRQRLPILGYTPVIVPRGDVAWRADFVLQSAAEANP